MNRNEHATELTSEVLEEIDRLKACFPAGRQQSALIGALRAAQDSNGGFLTPELIHAVARELSVPAVRAEAVASFYSMLETHPVGRHSISVCTNLSCTLKGGRELLQAIETHIGTKAGSSTADGHIYLKREEECLAACTGAPMMMVDHVYHENVTPETALELIDALK